MALLRKKPSQRIPFSLHNDKDPKKSTVLYWRLATKEEWAEHRVASAEVAYNPRERSMSISPEKITKQTAQNLSFAVSLIVDVENAELEGPDGSPVPATWPADADKIIEVMSEDVGLIELFVKRVMSAHQPDDERALGDREGGDPKN